MSKSYLTNRTGDYYSTIITTTSGRKNGLSFAQDYDLWAATLPSEKGEKLPRKYIVNANAAILFWDDDSKTVVRKCKEDRVDVVKAFLWAYFEKNSGLSRNKANKYLKEVYESAEISYEENDELIELVAKNLDINVEKLRDAIGEKFGCICKIRNKYRRL